MFKKLSIFIIFLSFFSFAQISTDVFKVVSPKTDALRAGTDTLKITIRFIFFTGSPYTDTVQYEDNISSDSTTFAKSIVTGPNIKYSIFPSQNILMVSGGKLGFLRDTTFVHINYSISKTFTDSIFKIVLFRVTYKGGFISTTPLVLVRDTIHITILPPTKVSNCISLQKVLLLTLKNQTFNILGQQIASPKNSSILLRNNKLTFIR